MPETCRACHEPVRWATTANGFRRPFNIEPDVAGEWLLNYEQARLDPDGNVVAGGWHAEWVSQGFRRETELHSDHRDSCPAKTEVGA